MVEAVYPIIGKEKILPFYLTGIGISNPEYHVKREKGLISHQFLYTRRGTGKLVVKGHSYFQKKGSLFYLPPALPHEYYPENGEWETCWVVFRGEGLTDMMQGLGFTSEMIGEISRLDSIEHIFHKLYHAANDSVYGKESCSALIYEYILEARRLFFSEAAGSAAGIVENAVAYIDKNFRKDITLEQLAHISEVSLQHFCRVFKAQMGMRPMEYVARRRIAEAKHILDNTEESIENIGKKTGYPNLSYFGTVFKKYEGISPSEYRKLERRSTSIYREKNVSQ